MPERLAIVTIDAGSDIDATSTLGKSRLGTSSGKGLVAEGFRDSGFLAYDSGRAYRTITLAAEIEGLSADEEAFGVALQKWIAAGRFGHCRTGLSLDGVEVDEHLLHGVDISSKVATFSPREDVRRLTKDMKIDWLGTFAQECANGLVGLDGRAMRELVQTEVEQKVPGSKLVASFSMIVDPVEAARRRMTQRGIIEYTDPRWMLHEDLERTVAELEERARRDEARTKDPVRLPARFVHYKHSGSKDGFILQPPASERFLDNTWLRNAGTILVDTTGAPKDDVSNLCRDLVARSLLASPYEFEVDLDRLKS